MSMNFGVLIFPQAEELDIVGPWEMLTMWAKHAQGPEHCLMVAQSLEPVICAKGMEITPHASFETCPALNYLLIPGGQGTRTEVNNRQLVDFIAQQAASCQAILSVCTGSFLLHAAGLLTGRMATTHWGSLQRMRALGDVNVVEERFVRDGDIWSSAGVSAGIDLMLAFIASVASEEAAGKVQFAAEYYPSGVKYGGFEKHADAPAYLRTT
jgi:transcriptional regulator GlxA family with amidase domain